MTWRIYQTLVDPLQDIPVTGTGGAVPEWLQHWRTPVWSKPGLGARFQAFAVIDPASLIAPEVTQFDKYSFPWSEPVRLPQRLHPALNQFLVYIPFNQANVVDIGWFNWMTEPVRQLPGLAPWQQQFFTISPRAMLLLEDVKIDKYYYPWRDPVLRRYRITTSLSVSRENPRSELDYPGSGYDPDET